MHTIMNIIANINEYFKLSGWVINARSIEEIVKPTIINNL